MKTGLSFSLFKLLNYYFGECLALLKNKVNAKENGVDTWDSLIPKVTA